MSHGLYHNLLLRMETVHDVLAAGAKMPVCPECDRSWGARSCGSLHSAVFAYQHLRWMEYCLAKELGTPYERPAWVPDPQDNWSDLARFDGYRCEECGGVTFPFMLKDGVWAAAVGATTAGIYCIQCVERRLGRFVRVEDLTEVPLNLPIRFGIEMGRGTRDVTQDDVTLRVPLP